MNSSTQRRSRRPDVGHAFALFKMKKSNLPYLFVMMFCMLQGSDLLGQSLKVLPEHPKPGDVLKISYSPIGSALEKEQQISCSAILFTGLMSDQISLTLKKEGDFFTATLPSAKGSQLVGFKFFKDEIQDQKSVDYQYSFYGDREPVVGAWYARAKLLTDDLDRRFYGLKTPDYSQAFEFLKLEKRSDIEDKYQIPITREYYACLLKINAPLAEKEILDYLANLNKEPKTEKVYIMNFWLYRISNKQELSQQSLAALKASYPNSPMFFSERYSAIEGAKTGEQMEGMVTTLISDYANNDDGKVILADFMPVLERKICKAYGRDLNLDKFYRYLNKDKDYLYRASSANEVAHFLSSKDVLLSDAAQISLLGLKYLDSAGMVANSKNAMTIDNFRNNLFHTYGYVLYQNEKYKEALTYLEKAITNGKDQDTQLQTDYALVLAKNKQFEKALPILENAISNGDSSEAVAEVFKESYLAVGGTGKDYELKLTELFETADKGGKFKLRKTMINEPMPDFNLLDATGKKVKLADLKGKTVVMDFWATWCFPCKQSFPGMQKLVNKYAGKEVVFLFINTLEKNRNGLTKSVGDYMKENKYNFSVLFDQPRKGNSTMFELFSALNLKSIPTKIVIDKTGNIRFKSVGYLGSDDAVVKELSEQIEAVR